ncbi:CopG family ribbon-helix-helix protein [Chrysiogenes arsenatis]|uniref:CopG family ribbon-helix-helix protein n=1 Tax=Chrysiogenes arsenatis TaxID=309797 RepID=UPI00040995BA|nr:CopG family ribbon-helix-helix protein [Chrysiogenes arsenatis]
MVAATKSVSLKLDNEIRERLTHIAEVKKRTAHWLMREAIKQYVEREEQQEAFRQATIHSWEEYQRTGEHITGEEAIAWLETWGETSEQQAPKCHN